jgi:hypothetical protein
LNNSQSGPGVTFSSCARLISGQSESLLPVPKAVAKNQNGQFNLPVRHEEPQQKKENGHVVSLRFLKTQYGRSVDQHLRDRQAHLGMTLAVTLEQGSFKRGQSLQIRCSLRCWNTFGDPTEAVDYLLAAETAGKGQFSTVRSCHRSGNTVGAADEETMGVEYAQPPFVQRAHDLRPFLPHQCLLTGQNRSRRPLQDYLLGVGIQLSETEPQIGPFRISMMEKIRVTAIIGQSLQLKES